jgi:hypothetical protein
MQQLWRGRACALGVLLSLTVGTSPAEEPDKRQRLGTWMAHYYEHPEPEALAGWMREVSASGSLEKVSARYPVMIFVSELASQNPGRVAGWCDGLVDLPAAHRVAFAWSFRNAGAPGSERCLRDLPADAEAKLRDLKVFSPLQRAPVTPGDLDLLWAVFVATGDERPVHMIVDVLSRPLPERGQPGSVEALLMNGAAKWSLASNARQHARVRRILEQRRSEASASLRQVLDELLAKPAVGEDS